MEKASNESPGQPHGIVEQISPSDEIEGPPLDSRAGWVQILVAQ